MKSGKMYFEGESVEKYEYMDQPHEVEAYGAEDRLYEEFMNVVYGVPAEKLSLYGYTGA